MTSLSNPEIEKLCEQHRQLILEIVRCQSPAALSDAVTQFVRVVEHAVLAKHENSRAHLALVLPFKKQFQKPTPSKE